MRGAAATAAVVAVCLAWWRPLATAGCQAPAAPQPNASFQDWHSGLEDFFHEVDADGNGQIEPTEAARYIGKSFEPGDYTGEELSRAVEYMKANLDSSDVDYTISEGEVVNHLRSLQKVAAPGVDAWYGSAVPSKN